MENEFQTLSKLEDFASIDLTQRVPVNFPEVSPYIEKLGNELIDTRETVDTFTMIFPGGEVEYESSKIGFTIVRIIVYGITVEPGVRAKNTNLFDTQILFDYESKDNVVTIKEPEQDGRDLSRWWNK